MKTIIYIILLIFSFGCNNNPKNESGFVSEENMDDENLRTIKKIGRKLNYLESILLQSGVLRDSIPDSLTSEVERLEFMTNEINGFRLITDQLSKSNPKSTVVRMNSYYEGCMFFAAYNRFLPNKLVLEYNNERKEVPLNDTTFEYKFRLNPYKLGENICNGFMVQGRDTYAFENRFTAVK
jgi:hypothetical protein